VNVAGFEDAFTSSEAVTLDEHLTVRVASLPGLTLLKLLAWSDRGRETNKDAADLYRLLTAYAAAGNMDRLYESELDLLESVGFDVEVAGAELLGRDVARLGSPIALEQIRFLLASPVTLERLRRQMAESATHTEATPAVDRVVHAFCQGIRGGDSDHPVSIGP
jgi:predicted nucleotidyltransferase